MAQEVLVEIIVKSGKANTALAKNSKAIGENKRKVDSLAAAKIKLEKLQKQEAVDIEIVNQKIKIQKALNEASAKSHLGLANAKEKETAVDRQLRKAEEKLAFLRSNEALKLQRINEQIKIQNNLNTALIKSEMGLATTKASVNAQGKQFRAQSGLNNAILLEAGRLASDASFGFTAIANNLSQIVSLGTSFVATTGSFKTAMQQLGRSLLGTGGVLIAVQLLISFLPKIINYFTSASKEAKKMKDELDSATKSINDQIDAFERLTKPIQQYGSNVLTLRESVKELSEESDKFAEALGNLEEKDFVLIDEAGTFRGEKAIQRLLFQYNRFLSAQKEEETSLFQLKKLKEELGDLEKGDFEEREELQSKIVAKEKEYLIGLRERRRIGKILFEKPFDFSEIDVDLEMEDIEINISSLFTDPSEDEELQKLLNEDIPEYIDDVEEAAETYARGKARESLISKVLKLDPKSRERDLKELEKSLDKFGSETIRQTEEYRNAVQSINDKWDAIERDQKLKHYKTIFGAMSDFFSEASRLNDDNKDLARASIIANSAAASIGIWQSYFDPKAPEKGTLALVASGIAQLGLIASTANALRSLNSDSAPSSAPTANVQAPAFNVVGASPLDLLMVDISNKLEKPIPAYVTAKGAIETLDEYYRNVRTGSNN